MVSKDAETPAERYRAVVELHDFGVRMKLAQLMRQDPAASPKELEGRLRSWLLDSGDEYPEPFVRVRGSGRFGGE